MFLSVNLLNDINSDTLKVVKKQIKFVRTLWSAIY